MNKFLIVLLASVALSVGCSQNRTSATSAVITQKFDANGTAVNRTKTVTNHADIETLASFFPEAGKGEKGPQAGSFQNAVDIRFKERNRRDIHVWTDYHLWTEGQGNWPLKSTFTSSFNEIMSK